MCQCVKMLSAHGRAFSVLFAIRKKKAKESQVNTSSFRSFLSYSPLFCLLYFFYFFLLFRHLNFCPQSKTQDHYNRHLPQPPTNPPPHPYPTSESLSYETLELQGPPPEFTPYSPPPTKKGLVIDRPYSFYKVASPIAPQSVTVIDSPFGPPTTLISPYSTQPGQNPFIPPPPVPGRIPYQHQQINPVTSESDHQKKDRPYPEDSIPVRPMPPAVAVMTETTYGGDDRNLVRGRSISGQNNRTLARPDKKPSVTTHTDGHTVNQRPAEDVSCYSVCLRSIYILR